jgi:hypothetical protein
VARSRKRHSLRWAARAGILALLLNALVPVHLAFDLDQALESTLCHAPGSEHHSLQWRVLALLIGHPVHDANDDHGGEHHGATCPVIAAFGALTGLVTTTAPTLPHPIAVAAVDPTTPAVDPPTIVPAVAYRSRAPPIV